eukprot:Phypoly_transcript_16386.p1 GENE.Phypoly_transcript_16386~~Phypoly_transcript_16386.p1  ORF type:complete len:149 (+),score=17.15 Phypoly_transcript_16386:314-760(+)
MNTPQEDWSSFLSVAGLKHPQDDRVFKAFEKARVTPGKLAASRDNWKSTLDGYGIPEGEIRVLIEAQLTKLSAPQATVANPAPPQGLHNLFILMYNSDFIFFAKKEFSSGPPLRHYPCRYLDPVTAFCLISYPLTLLSSSGTHSPTPN